MNTDLIKSEEKEGGDALLFSPGQIDTHGAVYMARIARAVTTKNF